ncbi:AAA-like domain-containing protein [Myxosarcina sp. GI1]|uniref:AAA-like domain-containing protein n=1 Tax=Myxosarcina sp. GI1 TaxID=1541065 RepID=UPI00068F84F5|nr:AAA-like domain-containing protein [Myxosarcina sp. GI1]
MEQYQYQVGGSLEENAVSYVPRKADRELYQRLLQGDCCCILNSRQMGKSSLLVQTFHRLKQQGYRCAIIDLTTVGSELITPLQWYKGLIAQIYSELGLTNIPQLKSWWRERDDFSYLQRLSWFIEELLSVHFPTERIFIFIDEVDTILSLDFTVDDFFALIRYCYERRTINPNYQRITFAISGVATPSDLICDRQRTPFNIGRAIVLDNFKSSEVKPLLTGLQFGFGNPDKLMQAVIKWTAGQPFLTQKLCVLIVSDSQYGLKIFKNSENSYVDNLVNHKIIKNWESQDEPEHLKTIRDRLLRQEKLAGRLLGIYQQILRGEIVKADDSREHIELFLSGLIIKKQGKLEVKNSIYRAIFNLEWVKDRLENLRPYSQNFQAWIDSGQIDRSRLLKGRALQDGLLWSQGKSLSDLDYQYLAASQESDRQEIQLILKSEKAQRIKAQLTEEKNKRLQEQKNARLQKFLLCVVSIALLKTSVMGIILYIQYRKATFGEIKALVSSAESLFNSNRRFDALVAAIKAYSKLDRINVNDDKLKSAVDRVLKKTVSAETESSRLSRFNRGFPAITFSPDGQTIATESLFDEIKLWQGSSTLQTTLAEYSDRILFLIFSPDAKFSISSSDDQTIATWNSDLVLDSELVYQQGCDLVRNYLKNNAEVKPSDRSVCNEK